MSKSKSHPSVYQRASSFAQSTDLYQYFLRGDLLYGLESVRKLFRPALKEKFNAPYPITVDDINNSILMKFIDFEGVLTESPSKLLTSPSKTGLVSSPQTS